MSIRSDICVLTLFELFKVSIEKMIIKSRLSIDVLREKKSAGVAPSDTIRCHTYGCTNGKATFSVAEARYPVDTVRNVSTDVVRHRAQSGIPSQSQVSSNKPIFLPCRDGAIVCDGAHG